LALALPDASSFRIEKAHPYVEIVPARGSLWFVGAVRIAATRTGEAGLDVFEVKRIDSDLAGRLSYDPYAAVAIVAPGEGIGVAGRFPGAAGAGKAAEQAQSFAQQIAGPAAEEAAGAAYIAFPRKEWHGSSFAAVVRRAGTIAQGEEPVLLSTALSLSGFNERAARLRGAIVAVSLLAVLLTIVLALVLSRSIASPVRLLSRAARRIAEGDFRAEVRAPVSGEIGELLEDFNGMARKLSADKLELDRYIAEIVGLKERSDGIIESIHEGLAVIDAVGAVESSNASFRGMFGDEAGARGSRLLEIERGPFDQSVLEASREALRVRARRGGITRRAADGRTFEIKLYPLVAAGLPEEERCIVIVEDTSERLAYEARVIQADKLASIGMLSAGVAHEINNPLSSILANLGNAISEAGDPGLIASLRVVESETLRIARIVRQLLDFSAPRRPGDGQFGLSPRCDANGVVSELLLLVGYPFKGDGLLEFREILDPDCPEAAIEEDELKQVLLNLLKNAIQAVGRRGAVRVETRAKGARAEISVADTGPGIPEDLIGRIFDPFFTARQSQDGGPGLGLGLSVTYGIVTKRGGSIRAANERGGGAIFVVELPAAGRNDGSQR
jgi:signal transduction histidine kinase